MITSINEIKRGDVLTRSWKDGNFEQFERYDVVYVNYSDREAVIKFGTIEKILSEENIKNMNFKK